jgi:O-antigen biosynthesis protein
MIKEIKRLIRLSILTYKLFGNKFLLKEIKRYIQHGPMPLVNVQQIGSDNINYQKFYSREKTKSMLEGFTFTPKISVITPVYNVLPKYLNACIKSVIAQHYQNWELCLYDDGSSNKKTIACLKTWQERDPRIKIQFGNVNKHISLASNEAIKMSSGDYIGLLDHDDELSPIALLEVINSINQNPTVDFIYTDEDFISQNGKYFNPHFKTDFNKALLLTHNYITHFAVIKKELGESICWFREGYEGAQDHDLFLRIIDKTNNIVHIPKVLYHWRQSETSTSLNYSGKSYADIAARKALTDYSQRNGFKAEIIDGPGLGVYRLKREIVTSEKVSIIIPFKDQVDLLKDCISSILEKTRYENFEILLISNNSTEEITFEYLELVKKTDSRIKVLEYNKPFNFSAINNWAVEQTDGEFILLLNNDIKIINEGWLEAMIEHIQLENVGIVGAKLLYSDNTVQHAGVIIGILGVAGHSHRFFEDTSIGYFYRPVVIQNLSAVTGACLLTKRKVWHETGGLDEINFKIAFNDIDYCLKVRSLGYDVVYTPYSRLYHYESKSRGPEDTIEKQKRFTCECKMMIEKWGTNRVPDPYYNVNLTLNSENFSLKVNN